MIIIILSFILVLGILIFVHEFGHFIVAKWVGVRVERFSLGFGPAIWKRTWGETEYQVASIPLGGYVKMSGEDPAEELEAQEEKEKEEEEKEEQDTEESKESQETVPAERLFSHQSLPARLAIVLAGPLMNIILALLLVPLVYMLGIEVDASLYQRPVIGYVMPEGPAAKAGLQQGDLVLSVNQKDLENWKDLKTEILFHPDRNLEFQIQRNGQNQKINVKTEILPAIGGGTVGIFAPWPSEIKRVLAGKPAEQAGLQGGDLILKIGPIETPHWLETQNYIQNRPGEKLELMVQRGPQRLSLMVTPEVYDPYPDMGFIGIEPVQPSTFRRFGFFESIKLGIQENVENTLTTFVVVGKLFTGDLKIKAMGGPVQIAEFTGAAAKEGFTHLILFMAFISLQLAILNLLPIPVLDGGHVLFMIIEGIKGTPLSIRKRLVAQQIGMALLLTLMIVVTFNDVARHKGRIFGLIKDLFP